VDVSTEREPESAQWLTPGVRGIGTASLLADLGHEVPTALLPSLLTSTLGAPASALGLIEGVSDALAGAAKFAGSASAVVGVLYTVASPSIAFAYASVLMLIAVVLLLGTNRPARSKSAERAEPIG
jgi:hypothetical protein